MSAEEGGIVAKWREEFLLSHVARAWFLLVAVYVISRMVMAVLNGSHLQYKDYWRTVESILHPDGSLDFLGLLSFSNEHFIAFAQYLYWLNIKFFAGSNITLGLIVIGIAVLTVVLLGLMLRRTGLESPLQWAVLAMTVALLFGLSGAWNFVYAMSGAAWLSANLFVVGAIYFRSSDRLVAAFFCATIATVSYGTGIFAWLAVIAVGAARRHLAQWWKEWPYVFGLATSLIMLTQLRASDSGTGTHDYLLVAQLAAQLLGNVVGLESIFADFAGYFLLITAPLCAAWLVFFARRRDAAGWVGVALYGWIAILVICQGRAAFLSVYGFPGRYYSVGVLAWLGFCVLLLLTFQEIRCRAVLPVTGFTVTPRIRRIASFATYAFVLMLTATALFSDLAGEVRKRDKRLPLQALNEIALQLNVVDGSIGYLEGFTNNTKPFSSTRRLMLAGHYPFIKDWNLDCGKLGTYVRPVSEGRTGGQIRRVVREKGLDSVNRISGIMPADSVIVGAVRCIVLTDTSGSIVGLGTIGHKRPHERGRRFVALARAAAGGYRVHFIDEGVSPISVASSQ